MSASFLQPHPVEQSKLPAVEVYEPVVVPTAHCDGACPIHVLPGGRALLNLWAYQIGTQDNLEAVLVTRLCMDRNVMREVALAMLTAAMLGDHEAEELRRNLD